MEISIFDTKMNDNQLKCFYPNVIGIWEVELSTTLGKQKELIYTYGDGVTRHLGFTDEIPVSNFVEVKDHQIIESDFSEEEFFQHAYDALKKFLIYKRRVWKNPEIKCRDIKTIYQPYFFKKETGFMGKERWFVHEPISGSKDKVKKHKVLWDYLQSKGATI